MRRWMLLLSITAYAGCFASYPVARTLHVGERPGVACSDETKYADNGTERPWCSIGRAAWGSSDPEQPVPAQAAQAGDTVLIAGGVYGTTSRVRRCNERDSRFRVALGPVNSGTAEHPITFRGDGDVHIRLLAGYAGPTIGAPPGKHHIVWDRVHVDERAAPGASCPDTGPVVFWGSNGSALLNSTVRGVNRDWSDNYSAVRTEYVDRVTIANNVLSHVTGNFGHNAAAIMMYDTSNAVVENNLITDSTTGIYVKGDHAAPPVQEHVTIRFNRMERLASKAIFLYAGADTRIYQNIIRDAPIAIRVAGTQQTPRLVVANNTLVSNGSPGEAAYSAYVGLPTDARIYNNIVVGHWGEAINHGDLPSTTGSAFEHNVYHGFLAFGSVGRRVISFATWKTELGHDRAAPEGIVADPMFADADYRLRPGSPAAARGVDILDLNNDGNTSDTIAAGAYVTGHERIGPIDASPGR